MSYGGYERKFAVESGMLCEPLARGDEKCRYYVVSIVGIVAVVVNFLFVRRKWKTMEDNMCRRV